MWELEVRVADVEDKAAGDGTGATDVGEMKKSVSSSCSLSGSLGGGKRGLDRTVA